MNICRIWCLACFGSMVLLLGACESSRWQQSLKPGPDAAPGLAPADPIRIREVQWDRVQSTLEELRAAEAASSVHPQEWSPEAKLAHKAKLIQGLQISEPPAGVRVLGKSEFRTTDSAFAVDQGGGGGTQLEQLARSLGADTVMWSSRLIGKADRVVQEPVTTYSSGSRWWRDGDRNRPESFNEQQTTWIPVRVQADETAYIAFFLRTR